jgi:hypothetical protein
VPFQNEDFVITLKAGTFVPASEVFNHLEREDSLEKYTTRGRALRKHLAGESS